MGIKTSKIDEYINSVFSHVKCKRAHNEIRQELLDHLEEKIEDLIENGINEEAVKKSILKSFNFPPRTIPQVQKESVENPELSRSCNRGVKYIKPMGNW